MKNSVASVCSEPNSNEEGKDSSRLKPEKKRKSRRKKREAGAPKPPLSGYIRFMNVRREELRVIHPNATAIDLTKIIGEEWNRLSETKKKPYLDAAVIDKDRYSKEKQNYEALKRKFEEIDNATLDTNGIDLNKVEPNTLTNSKKCIDQTNDTKLKAMKIDSERMENGDTVKQQLITNKVADVKDKSIELPVRKSDCDVPIFTDEFLDHNKSVDSELRTLRKCNGDYEQQNAVLEKHIENMKNCITTFTNETNELTENNKRLEMYAEALKERLAGALSGLAIPSEPNGATTENICKFMNDLKEMSSSNSHGPAALNKAKDIIRKVDLKIDV